LLLSCRLLIYTASVTPFRIAFFQIDTIQWVIIDLFVDGIFALDLIFNFLFAFFDDDYNLITDKATIAKKYLFSWFAIDLISIVPINLILQNNKDYGSLARIARLPRLYRLIKMTKLARMLKIVKERNTLLKHVNDILKLSAGVERLLYVGFIFLLLTHITSCLWYLLATFEEDNPENWVMRNLFQDESMFDVKE
jgi:hypothetical protein